LAGDLAFLDIARVIEAVMGAHEPRAYESVEDLLAVDAWARALASDHPGKQATAGG
jgi:1-deoxy-D-xylulose 5-phosphate reductoisomerase